MLQFRGKNYIALGFILILLVGLHYLGWLTFLERSIQSVIIPISGKITHWRIFSQDSYDYYTNKQGILDNYSKCMTKNQNLEVANTTLTNLEQENAELRKQLNFFNRREFTHVTAEVVGRNTDSLEKMIIINIGEDKGVQIGQPVQALDEVGGHHIQVRFQEERRAIDETGRMFISRRQREAGGKVQSIGQGAPDDEEEHTCHCHKRTEQPSPHGHHQRILMWPSIRDPAHKNTGIATPAHALGLVLLDKIPVLLLDEPHKTIWLRSCT